MSENTNVCDPETSIVYHLSNLFAAYCKRENKKLTQTTAHLIVRIILLDSSWKNVLCADVKRCEIQSFVEKCYDFLFDQCSISSATVRIQCFFFGRYLSREQYKEHKKQIVMKNCYPLLQKLKKSFHNHTEYFNDMHNDLVQLILIKEGLNDTDDHTAFLEMKAAVSSVFPVSALSSFVMSNQKTKMAFINEVSSIAAGIRLHSWYSNRAGKFMLDVGKIMKEVLPKTCEDLHEEYNNVKKDIESYQKSLKEKVSQKVSDEDKEFQFQKLLLMYRTNFYRFLKMLKDGIDEIAVQTYKLDYAFTMQIKELNTAMNTGPFTQADRVYPQYKELSKTWKSIQREGYLLDFYVNLFQELREFNECINEIDRDKISEVTLKDASDNHSSDEESPSIVFPEDMKNFQEVTLEFQEFCTYFCSMGILIPCKRELGIIMFKNLCYGFSTREALEYFNRQPEKCLHSISQYMHAFPELIVTFGMEKKFNFPIINNLQSARISPKFICNSSAQTVTHPIEKNVDTSYNWNQWSLRKQALKYVDLLNKKTHSTQTDLSHFRRENFSQVYLPKNNWTQTRRDTGTTMARTGIPELNMKIRKSFL